MKKLLYFLLLVPVLALVGCSDDDDAVLAPVDGPDNTATSTWNATGEYWVSLVNASGYDNFMGFSFTTQDTTISGVPKGMAAGWDIAFKRDAVKLNGGASSNNQGDLEAYDLGEVSFTSVTIADTAGVTWTSDAIDFFINNWYDYDSQTHQLTANGNVWSMVDAEGDNFIKFRVDSMVGAAQPPDMGAVYMTYFYQSTADSRDLSGATSEVVIPVGAVKTYFDFSSGTTVTPTSPMSSTAWDIAFYAYDISQNSGPNGSGSCAAFPAYDELTLATDIDGFTTQPASPMFSDIFASVLTEWYNYTGPPAHQLLSKDHVYLVRTGGMFYKLKIVSYYAKIGGVPTSGWYTFNWVEL
jgi:heme-binding HmuY-like protein